LKVDDEFCAVGRRGAATLTRLRWFILLFGPLPIFGASWITSAWFRSEPRAVAARNDALLDAPPAVSSGGPSVVAEDRPSSIHAAENGLQRACRAAADRLVKRAGGGLRAITRAPFVVAGDLDAEDLQAYYGDTIAPAVRAMQCRYFRSRPHQPITVLVFRGEESYNRFARELFGDGQVSIYGYYKPSARTLLVNIATGNGTLLHELTHALMDFEIPDVPAWLNEGIASLHEQCRFRADQRGPWIEGLVNWRLGGLQSTVRKGRLRSLAALVEADDFRGPLVGTNYAQARYFCLYLQRKGLLEEFFRDFRAHRAGDPFGSAAIARVLGDREWTEVDRDFQAWVLELSE
jgi:hypothetical protein